jgi:hypothetical protein
MKKLFYTGVIGIILFEVANVYFIMPMPGGSQEINSIDWAYTLYNWRWLFRGLLFLLLVAGAKTAFSGPKWLPIAALLLSGGIAYATNFSMAADTMFYQPKSLILKNAAENSVEKDRLVIGVEHEGQAKAYPIQFLGYHHQVRDSIGNQPIMVTYCTVCRTGRVFEPIVNGKVEDFRLVGMDHFNAMFEDRTTQSWWRQASGEAIAGRLKGQTLPEFPSVQTTLQKWLERYPNALIMQPDPYFQVEYDSMSTYEKGRLRGTLTRKDTASWQQKSWVVGVEVGTAHKAYDWNLLQKERILYDVVGNKPIAVVLSQDNSSFVVLERANNNQLFTLQNDTLISAENKYHFFGNIIQGNGGDLKKVDAYQEYWHSWQAFHPQ